MRRRYKLNILITSVGRRTKLIEYFKREFNLVVATDLSKYAPALYSAHKYYLVPSITDEKYIETIFKICDENNINGILSLIDPELELLSKHKQNFAEKGITIIGSPAESCNICFDKFKMYEFLEENEIKTARTYNSLESFKKDLDKNIISFPVFFKPAEGSASIGIHKVYDYKNLEYLWQQTSNYIIQEFMDGQEIGCDVYVDLLSKEVISIFTKYKLNMRAGETDKAVSFKDDKLFKIIKNFVEKLGVLGPIDIDIFKVNNEYYISEVNPRFGGGYLIAYECGENFPKFIRNNMSRQKNSPNVGSYKENMCMMKCDDVKMISIDKL